MKTLKLADLFIQAAIVVSCLIYLVITDNRNDSFIYAYYILGGWQLLSFFIHLFLNENWISTNDRKLYGKTILGTFIIGLVSYALLLAQLPAIILFLAALLFISPIYAVCYFLIGVSEWKRIRQKELVHLK